MIDVRNPILDGCVCPCPYSCGARTPIEDCLDTHDELARRRLIAEGVTDAIEQLEALADWWMRSDDRCDYSCPPLYSLIRPESLSLLALSAYDAARCDIDEATAKSFFDEYGLKIHALPFLEAAAMLRDGWRRKEIG